MRKFLIPIAAAASTLALAAPASAQPSGPRRSISYQPYNYGNGYNGINFARSMESRVQRIRQRHPRHADAACCRAAKPATSTTRPQRLQRRHLPRVAQRHPAPARRAASKTRSRNLEVRVAREANDWNNRLGRHRRY